jgi:hypothetical protein
MDTRATGFTGFGGQELKAKVGAFCMIASILCVMGLSGSTKAGATNSPPYSLTWSTIDGGGGTSSSASFSVTTTFGQPDVGTVSGNLHLIDLGFWSIFSSLQIPGGPTVEIELVADTITILWPIFESGFFVETTADLNQPAGWMQIAPPYQTNSTHNFYVVPIPEGDNYYRIAK